MNYKKITLTEPKIENPLRTYTIKKGKKVMTLKFKGAKKL